MRMKGPLILIEPLVWIRGVSKNPLPSLMVEIVEMFFLLPLHSLSDLIKINDHVSRMVGGVTSL